MDEKKIFTIGGKKFEFRPLTLRQRQLASPIGRKLLVDMQSLAPDEFAGDPALTPKKSYTIAIDLQDIITGEGFPEFLATILVPAEASAWTEGMVKTNAPAMLEIDEDTQSEVLHAFLFRQSRSTGVEMPFTQPSIPPEQKSESSGETNS